MLGFTSLYREGFAVVLFLQSYLLKRGGRTVLYGKLLGLVFSGIVAVLTFLGHRRLPYRRMLLLTGVMLGAVLLVMVGEEAQERQLAHWIPTTSIPLVAPVIPPWIGLWFSVFPTVETLVAQAVAALLVIGSYFTASSNCIGGDNWVTLLNRYERSGDRRKGGGLVDRRPPAMPVRARLKLSPDRQQRALAKRTADQRNANRHSIGKSAGQR